MIINVDGGDYYSGKMSKGDCTMPCVAVFIALIIILVTSVAAGAPILPLITYCRRKWTNHYNKLTSGKPCMQHSIK